VQLVDPQAKKLLQQTLNQQFNQFFYPTVFIGFVLIFVIVMQLIRGIDYFNLFDCIIGGQAAVIILLWFILN
jgi:hypothetical protein